MKVPFLKLWISRQEPVVKQNITLHPKQVNLRVEAPHGEKVVPRKVAGQVYDLILEVYIAGRRDGNKPKKDRKHPSRTVEPAHQEIKRLYGIVAAKKGEDDAPAV